MTQRQRKTLSTAVLFNWTSFAVYSGGALLLTPFVLAKLGPAGFGMWVLVQSFSGYYGLINLGMGAALSRFVTKDLTEKNFDSLNQTLATVVAFFAGTGLIVLLLSVLLRRPAASILAVPATDAPLFGITMIVAASGVIIDFFAVVSHSIIGACERFELASLLGIARQVTYMSATAVVLHVAPSFLTVALVSTATALVSLLVNAMIARRLVPEAGLAWEKVSKRRLRDLLGFGAGSILLSVANLIRLRLGNFIVARYSGVAAVAGYSIASGLITNFSTIVSSATSMMGVRFTRLVASGNLVELKRSYKVALFVSSTLAFVIGSHMLVFGESFLRHWLRREMPETLEILQVLVVAYMFALAQAPSWGMMLAQSKHHFMARVTAVESVVNVVIGIVVAREYGALGFAISTAATMSITKLTVHPWYGAKIAQLRVWEYLAPMLYPALTGLTCLAFAWLSGLHAVLRDGSIYIFFIAACGSLSASVVILVLLSRGKDYFPPFIASRLTLIILSLRKAVDRNGSNF